jgi:hypothetical protein
VGIIAVAFASASCPDGVECFKICRHHLLFNLVVIVFVQAERSLVCFVNLLEERSSSQLAVLRTAVAAERTLSPR